MATKTQLEEENGRLRTEVEEYEKTRKHQQEKIEQLTASGKEKDLDIKRKIDMIVSRGEQIIKLRTRISEMQKHLDKSWDKEQAKEVIGVLLEKLASSRIINTG